MESQTGVVYHAGKERKERLRCQQEEDRAADPEAAEEWVAPEAVQEEASVDPVVVREEASADLVCLRPRAEGDFTAVTAGDAVCRGA